MGLDELLVKVVNPQHGRNADNLHSAVLDTRVALLMDYFPQGLEGEDKTKWDAASAEERVEMMQEKDYMLKPELAYKLIRRVAVYVMKKHNPTVGEELEKAFKKRYDDSSSEDEKADAQRTLELLKPSLKAVGFDIDSLEDQAVEKGFSREIWTQHTRSIPQLSRMLYTSGYVDLMQENEDALYAKLDVVKGETGLKADLVKGKGKEEAIDVLISYTRHKRADDIAGFKEAHKEYH